MKQREIKFRAYHKIQKRMFEVYGLGLDFVTENTLDGVSPGDNCWQGDELKNIEIMQFTGLKDKNGVEIYEGDVMKRIYTYEVRFDKGRFYLHHKSGYHINNGFDKDFEIIGNIHEHKHLLK